ncbi:PHD-type domain-containing protein [Entamoeba marina]
MSKPCCIAGCQNQGDIPLSKIQGVVKVKKELINTVPKDWKLCRKDFEGLLQKMDCCIEFCNKKASSYELPQSKLNLVTLKSDASHKQLCIDHAKKFCDAFNETNAPVKRQIHPPTSTDLPPSKKQADEDTVTESNHQSDTETSTETREDGQNGDQTNTVKEVSNDNPKTDLNSKMDETTNETQNLVKTEKVDQIKTEKVEQIKTEMQEEPKEEPKKSSQEIIKENDIKVEVKNENELKKEVKESSNENVAMEEDNPQIKKEEETPTIEKQESKPLESKEEQENKNSMVEESTEQKKVDDNQVVESKEKQMETEETKEVGSEEKLNTDDSKKEEHHCCINDCQNVAEKQIPILQPLQVHVCSDHLQEVNTLWKLSLLRHEVVLNEECLDLIKQSVNGNEKHPLFNYECKSQNDVHCALCCGFHGQKESYNCSFCPFTFCVECYKHLCLTLGTPQQFISNKARWKCFVCSCCEKDTMGRDKFIKDLLEELLEKIAIKLEEGCVIGTSVDELKEFVKELK